MYCFVGWNSAFVLYGFNKIFTSAWCNWTSFHPNVGSSSGLQEPESGQRLMELIRCHRILAQLTLLARL